MHASLGMMTPASPWMGLTMNVALYYYNNEGRNNHETTKTQMVKQEPLVFNRLSLVHFTSQKQKTIKRAHTYFPYPFKIHFQTAQIIKGNNQKSWHANPQ
jgi:hypothetical protein